MDLICEDCGYIFSEEEADEMDIDLEFENGVSGLFPDHHHGTCLICPECGSEYITEYEEEEQEEEEE